MAIRKRRIKKEEPKVIGYLRVSTGRQDLENQKLGILELANKKGWKLEIFEETVSGKVSYKYRKLGKLIDSLNSGDVLVLPELSRLGRSMLEILTLLCDLKRRNIKIYVVKGGYELNGDSIQSKIITAVLCMAAEIERDLRRR